MAVNGVQYDFESLELRVARKIYEGTKEVSYKVSREVGKVMGMSRKRIGTTIGTEESEASFTMFRSYGAQLLADLSAESGGKGYGLVEFDIVANYANDGDAVQTDIVSRCTITEVDLSGSAGADALEMKFTCDVRGDISINGARMIEPTSRV